MVSRAGISPPLNVHTKGNACPHQILTLERRKKQRSNRNTCKMAIFEALCSIWNCLCQATALPSLVLQYKLYKVFTKKDCKDEEVQVGDSEFVVEMPPGI